MSTTALAMLEKAGVDVGTAKQVCILFNGEAGEIPVAEARNWLGRMAVFDEYDDPDWNGAPTVPGVAVYGFQIWIDDDWMIRSAEVDGIYTFQRIPLTTRAFMASVSRNEGKVRDISSGETWRLGKPDRDWEKSKP